MIDRNSPLFAETKHGAIQAAIEVYNEIKTSDKFGVDDRFTVLSTSDEMLTGADKVESGYFGAVIFDSLTNETFFC